MHFTIWINTLYASQNLTTWTKHFVILIRWSRQSQDVSVTVPDVDIESLEMRFELWFGMKFCNLGEISAENWDMIWKYDMKIEIWYEMTSFGGDSYRRVSSHLLELLQFEINTILDKHNNSYWLIWSKGLTFNFRERLFSVMLHYTPVSHVFIFVSLFLYLYLHLYLYLYLYLYLDLDLYKWWFSVVTHYTPVIHLCAASVSAAWIATSIKQLDLTCLGYQHNMQNVDIVGHKIIWCVKNDLNSQHSLS